MMRSVLVIIALLLVVLAILIVPVLGQAQSSDQTLLQSLWAQLLKLEVIIVQLFSRQATIETGPQPIAPVPTTTPSQPTVGQIYTISVKGSNEGIVNGNNNWVFTVKNPVVVNNVKNNFYWTVSGLPEGTYAYPLSPNHGLSFYISGGAKAAGIYPIVISVRDSHNNTGVLHHNLIFRAGAKRCVPSCYRTPPDCIASCMEEDEAFPAMCRPTPECVGVQPTYAPTCGYRAGECVDLNK